MDRSINSIYKECKELFDVLLDAFPEQLQRASLTSAKVQDELDRFKLWGSNLGAGHPATAKISLDWRIRNASDLREEIIQLLDEIVDALSNLHEIVSGSRENQHSVIEADNGEEGEESVQVSEAVELFGIVSDSTAALFRLTMIIQKATPRDRFVRASINVHRPFIPTYDLQHVGAKFPKLERNANVWLQQKLASAITQRRQFFRYSRDHQERKTNVKAELSAVAPDKRQQPDRALNDMISRIHPESLAPTQASTLLLDHLDVARFDVDGVGDTMSQTSFATSVNESNETNTLHVPRLEEVSHKSREFECPYCCAIISPRNQQQWKKHVYEDLRPYVCTSQDCNTKLFSDRRTWFDHELSQHRQSYRCLFCRCHAFHFQHELRGHLSKHHNEILATNTPDELLEAAQEVPTGFAAADCPFCDDWAQQLRVSNPHIPVENVTFVTPKQFRNHLANHMEQLALFALPKNQDFEGSGKSVGAFAGESRSSRSSVQFRDETLFSEENYELIHDDYTVTLISTTTDAYKIASIMLDKIHPNLPVSKSDPNFYSLGHIGHHNVVVVVPKDTSDLSSLSMDSLLQTFPKLCFGFSIEIGAGVPNEPGEDPQTDLHLGDIVVDYEESIVTKPGDKMVSSSTRSSLRKALPPVVQYALQSIRSQIENEGLRIRLFTDPIAFHTGKEDLYPGAEYDNMFVEESTRQQSSQTDMPSVSVPQDQTNLDIKNDSSGQAIFPPCDRCRQAQEECFASTKWNCERCPLGQCTWYGTGSGEFVRRKSREDPNIPVVHFGKVARDTSLWSSKEWTPIIDSQHAILCVEGHSFSPLASFPYITVRGVAEYISSRPRLVSPKWEEYAITNAIAYAMHVLDMIQEPLDHKDSEWFPYKEKIRVLYQSGRSIPDIRHLLLTSYGFLATPCQYQRKIIAWKLVKSDTIVQRKDSERQQLEEELEQASAEFSIKCICTRKDDDGSTILCDGCNTWQHAQCYYETGSIPDENDTHYCVDCEPREIDRDRAINFQNDRRVSHTAEEAADYLHFYKAMSRINSFHERLEGFYAERTEAATDSNIIRNERSRDIGYIEGSSKSEQEHDDSKLADSALQSIDQSRVLMDSPKIQEVEAKMLIEHSPVSVSADWFEEQKERKDHEERQRTRKGFEEQEGQKDQEEQQRLEDYEKQLKLLKAQARKRAIRQALEEREEQERGQFMRESLRKDGYTDEEVDDLMTKTPDTRNTDSAPRPTYMKVNKKHIDPRTLDHYRLEWQWEHEDQKEYIHIFRHLSDEEAEILFEHTRHLLATDK